MSAVLALAFSVAAAQDYFVDSERGDDAAAGTSAAAAWKTAAKVDATAFAPGDHVRFKRGGFWREHLRPRSDGAEGMPITFEAYGDAKQPKPRFCGSDALDGAAFAQQGASRIFTCAHQAPVYAVLVDGIFLFRHDPAAWEHFDAEAKPWSFCWKDGTIKIKLYDPATSDPKFTKLAAFAYQHPQTQGAWRAVVEDDVISSMEPNFTAHHHLVFRDLIAEDTGRLDDNGGYGVRIQGSEDILVENVEVYRAGKHHFGCINSHRVVHRGCVAAWAYPGQDNGGNSAWVSYSGPDSSFPAGASEYWNCTYDHTEDTWSELYNQWGLAHYYIMEMHGPKVGSVLMDHLVSHGGGWSLNNSEHPGEVVQVRGGLIENARLVVVGSGVVVDGLRMTGEKATIDISGTKHLFQNLVMTGTRTGGWDKNTAILLRGSGTTIRFSTIVTAAAADGSQSCIATTAPGNAPECYGDILISNGPVLDLADAALGACDHNLYRTGVRIVAGGERTMAQWRMLGFDAASGIVADPRFVDIAAGDCHLQPTSPALDNATVATLQRPGSDADGAARPQGKACAIGAYERAPAGKAAKNGSAAPTAGQRAKPSP